MFLSGLSGMDISNFSFGDDRYIEYTEIFKNIKLNDDCGKFFSLDNSKQNIVLKNDILVTNTSETLNEIGISSIFVGNSERYLNSFCFILRIQSRNINSDYVNYLLNSPTYRRTVIRLGQGSTRYNLSKKEYSKINIKLPILNEQTKIAKFFSLLDKQIELWERKLQFNELKKKYYLNSLFANNNSNYLPKLRFVGFKDDWFSISLKDIEILPCFTNVENSNFLDATAIMNKKYLIYSNEKCTYAPQDSIVFIKDGSNSGKFFYSSEQTRIASTCSYIITSQNNQFIHYLLEKNESIVNSLLIGETIPHLYKSSIINICIIIPNNEKEQKKIMELLFSLDYISENIKNNINNLLKNKKYFLQNLFI